MISGNFEFDIAVDLHISEGDRRTIRARLNRVHNGVFELSSPAYIRPDARLEVRHPERAMECRVMYCKRQPSRTYRLGVVCAIDGERRSEKRIGVDLPATLHVPDSLLKIAVRIADVSRSGLGLELSTPISVGTLVSIELTAGTAIGEICHCTKTLDKYRAGIRIQEFLTRSNGQHTIAFDHCASGGPGAIDALARSLEERQSRYQAILFSLAPLPAGNVSSRRPASKRPPPAAR